MVMVAQGEHTAFCRASGFGQYVEKQCVFGAVK